METLLQQLKQRRLHLGLKQNDMVLRIGVSRQQYQRLESKGNPRLETLELIAKGLNSDIMLVPKEKLASVLAILDEQPEHQSVEGPESHAHNVEGNLSSSANRGAGLKQTQASHLNKRKNLSDDPWQDLLGEETDRQESSSKGS